MTLQLADLQADCSRCLALCCVALRFDASPDFAFSKAAGTPCVNLADDLRCTIHADLTTRGFGGCVAYDCQGAGQKVSQVHFAGRDWRTDPTTARWMIAVYPVVRQLHQLLGFLFEAREFAGEHADEVETAIEEIDALTYLTGEELLRVDVAARRSAVTALIGRL